MWNGNSEDDSPIAENYDCTFTMKFINLKIDVKSVMFFFVKCVNETNFYVTVYKMNLFLQKTKSNLL